MMKKVHHRMLKQEETLPTSPSSTTGEWKGKVGMDLMKKCEKEPEIPIVNKDFNKKKK